MEREVEAYNLDVILSVGYRVRSLRGTQFRRWATTVLREYLVKGFAMDDARLKQAEQWDYFDKWLARIRDIRASEKRFYQKVRDLYATAIDYDKTSEQAHAFFKKVQNKMLWAVTGRNGRRIDREPRRPGRPQHGPDQLERLGGAQGRRRHRQELPQGRGGRGAQPHRRDVSRLRRRPGEAPPPGYHGRVGRQARRVPVLQRTRRADHAGRLRMDVAQTLAVQRFEAFDANRRAAEALAGGG